MSGWLERIVSRLANLPADEEEPHKITFVFDGNLLKQLRDLSVLLGTSNLAGTIRRCIALAKFCAENADSDGVFYFIRKPDGTIVSLKLDA